MLPICIWNFEIILYRGVFLLFRSRKIFYTLNGKVRESIFTLPLSGMPLQVQSPALKGFF